MPALKTALSSCIVQVLAKSVSLRQLRVDLAAVRF